MAVQAVHTRPNRWLTPQTRALQREYIGLSNTPYIIPLKTFIDRVSEELRKINKSDNVARNVNTVVLYSIAGLAGWDALNGFDVYAQRVLVLTVMVVALLTKGYCGTRIFQENHQCLMGLLNVSTRHYARLHDAAQVAPPAIDPEDEGNDILNNDWVD